MESKVVRKDLKSVHEDMFVWSERLSKCDGSNLSEVHTSINTLSERWRPFSVSFNENFGVLNAFDYSDCYVLHEKQDQKMCADHSTRGVDFEQASGGLFDIHTALFDMACQLQAISDANPIVLGDQYIPTLNDHSKADDMDSYLTATNATVHSEEEAGINDPFSLAVDDVLESEESHFEPNRNSMMLFLLSENAPLSMSNATFLLNDSKDMKEVSYMVANEPLVCNGSYHKSFNENPTVLVRKLSFDETLQDSTSVNVADENLGICADSEFKDHNQDVTQDESFGEINENVEKLDENPDKNEIVVPHLSEEQGTSVSNLSYSIVEIQSSVSVLVDESTNADHQTKKVETLHYSDHTESKSSDGENEVVATTEITSDKEEKSDEEVFPSPPPSFLPDVHISTDSSSVHTSFDQHNNNSIADDQDIANEPFSDWKSSNNIKIVSEASDSEISNTEVSLSKEDLSQESSSHDDDTVDRTLEKEESVGKRNANILSNFHDSDQFSESETAASHFDSKLESSTCNEVVINVNESIISSVTEVEIPKSTDTQDKEIVEQESDDSNDHVAVNVSYELNQSINRSTDFETWENIKIKRENSSHRNVEVTSMQPGGRYEEGGVEENSTDEIQDNEVSRETHTHSGVDDPIVVDVLSGSESGLGHKSLDEVSQVPTSLSIDLTHSVRETSTTHSEHQTIKEEHNLNEEDVCLEESGGFFYTNLKAVTGANETRVEVETNIQKSAFVHVGGSHPEKCETDTVTQLSKTEIEDDKTTTTKPNETRSSSLSTSSSKLVKEELVTVSTSVARKKAIFSQKTTSNQTTELESKEAHLLQYKQKRSNLIKAKLEALQQTASENQRRNTAIEDELRKLRLSRSALKSSDTVSSSEESNEHTSVNVSVDNASLPDINPSPSSDKQTPTVSPSVAANASFFAAKPFRSPTSPTSKKIMFTVKPPTAPKPKIKAIELSPPPVPPLPDKQLLEKEFLGEGGSPQPFTASCRKPQFRSVSFGQKKKEVDQQTQQTLSLVEKDETKPPLCGHVSQDSGIECPELLVKDTTTEKQLPAKLLADEDKLLSTDEEKLLLDDEAKDSTTDDLSVVKVPSLTEACGDKSLSTDVASGDDIESTVEHSSTQKPFLIPLQTETETNSLQHSHSDIEDERPYTDDDIDDFTDEDILGVPNSNNNNLHVVAVPGQLNPDRSNNENMFSQLDAAVVHENNCQTSECNSVEVPQGSKPSKEDFVQPPLPPPPPDAFLNSQATSPIGNGFKVHSKAKPAMWRPTNQQSDDEFPLPPPPGADELSMSSPPPEQSNKPKGFRSVSVPVAKDFNDKSCNHPPAEVPYPRNGRLSPLRCNNGRSSPCAPETTRERSQSSMSNASQSSGYVTLLRDTRRILIKSGNSPAPAKVESSFTFQGSPFPSAINADARLTPASQLPEGAVYQTTTQEGDLVHTDTYYPAGTDGGDNQPVVLERTKKTTIVRAPHHTGIGPINDNGVPYALRTTVDDSKHWYKNMFKQMHKIERDDDTVDGRPSSAEDATSVNDRTVHHHASMEIEKPKKVGRITEYKPAEPYVVENNPIKLNLNAPEAPRRRRMVLPPNQYQPQYRTLQRSSSLEDFSNMQWGDFFDDILNPKPRGTIWDLEMQEQTKNVPIASTSYKSPSPEKATISEIASPPVTAASYTAYRNAAMSASTKPPVSHSVNKQQKQKHEEDKLRQPARTKFEFAAQTAKEMSAKKDQTIIITRRVDNNWYMAETVDGKKSGIIPVQYVEIISTTASVPEKPLRNGQAKAKFDFAGKTKVELSFNKGDEIVLLKKVDANWYKGKVGGKTGILPTVYIDVIVEPETSDGAKPKQKIPKELEVSPKVGSPRTTTPSQSSQHSHSLSQTSSNSDPDESDRKQRAAFLAHSVVDAAVQLQPKDSHKRGGEFDLSELDRVVDSLTYQNTVTTENDGDFPAPPPAQTLLAPSVPSYPSSNISSQPSTPRLHTPPPSVVPEVDFGQVIGRYVALYSYEASNEDELDLMAGDLIMVVETCDDGWFVGTCQRTGAFGTFPGNYVTPANS